jgi:mono/diheme cytochrome c family protein
MLAVVLGCARAAEAPPRDAETPEAVDPVSEPVANDVPDDARGARLYDNWRGEKEIGDAFVPDSARTPELDGKGGPNGNGTLDDGDGRPLPNTGHDYRLKNLFGWDLRGARGVYGPNHQNKAFVLAHDLLSEPRSEQELRAFLAGGTDGVPAYGAVLDDKDIEDLTAFLAKTRSGALAGPDAIFRLEPAAPKSYVLHPGGDAARGRARFQRTCADCHGADGTKIAIDETESVGTLSRAAGYEVWFKILHGQPGTAMGRQVAESEPSAQARAILDLFATLCDRAAFPARAGAEDVPDGDPRCGAYLR